MQNTEKKSSVFEHLMEARKEQAEVFTNNKQNFLIFNENYQGVKLSPNTMKALKRAQ